MLEKLLHQLHLGNKEQTVYKLILEHGKIAPALLSRLAKINRTTVYSVAKELKDKGLIIEDLGGKTLYYLPARESQLESLVGLEYEKAKQKENSIRELQEFLKQIPESKTFSVPKIRFIEEDDIEKYLYDAFPRWISHESDDDTVLYGFQDHTFAEKFETWIDWSWDKTPSGHGLKLFTNKSDIENKMNSKHYAKRRDIKFLSNSNFTASQWVAGSYTIFVVTKQKPYYLVEIHDSVIAHNLRELFKNMWGMVDNK